VQQEPSNAHRHGHAQAEGHRDRDVLAVARGVRGKAVAIGADPFGALRFTKTTLTAKAGTVVFAFANPSQVPHASPSTA
jgi:hypothetical protein